MSASKAFTVATNGIPVRPAIVDFTFPLTLRANHIALPDNTR